MIIISIIPIRQYRQANELKSTKKYLQNTVYSTRYLSNWYTLQLNKNSRILNIEVYCTVLFKNFSNNLKIILNNKYT